MSRSALQPLFTTEDSISYFFKHSCALHSKNNFIFPPIKKPSKFLDTIGREMITKTILYHFSLMRKIASQNFYLNEYQDLMDEVIKIAHFMTEALGCSAIYTNEYGCTALLDSKLPFNLSENARELWLNLYIQTLKDVNFPKNMLPDFWNWLELFSLYLLDTSTLQSLPKRFYFESIQKSF